MNWFGGARRRAHRRARSGRLFILAVAVAMAGACGPMVVDQPGPMMQYAAGVGPGLGGDAMVLVARVDDASEVRRYEIVQISRDGRSWRYADYWAVPARPTEEPDVVITAWYEGSPPCETEGGQPCPTYPEPEVHAAITTAREAPRQACAPDGPCWRTVPGQLAIEESTDEGTTWSTVWSVSGPQRERYAELLTTRASNVAGYPIDSVDRELHCTGLYIDPRSGVVVAACGLVGFVSRDTGGQWTMLGFDGGRFGTFFLDEPTASDSLAVIKILLGGWFILLLGAEAYALRHRRGAPPGPRRWVAALVSIGGAPLLLTGGDIVDTPGEGTFAWRWAACLFGGVLAWIALYIYGRREIIPLWTVALAVTAPAVGWYLHRLVAGAEIYPALGRLGIGTVLLLALASSIALGIGRPRRNAIRDDGESTVA